MANASAYLGPLSVTLAYIVIYYAFQVHIMNVKFRLAREYKAKGERFDRYFGADREMLAADRLQLNTLEHMPPFLALLWLNAVFVSVTGATIAGAVYLVSRCVYPLMVGKRIGSNVKPRIVFATGAGYAVLGYFLVALVWTMVGST